MFLQRCVLAWVLGGAGLLVAGCGAPETAGDGAAAIEPSDVRSVTISVRIEDWDDSGEGTLYVNAGDEDVMVAEDALEFWLMDQGRTVYYNYRHHKSGFEAEGHGLMRYDVESGEKDVVFEDDLIIVEVTEAHGASGRPALIVEMEDGGMGVPLVAVVDPGRGRVFRLDLSSVLEVGAGTVTVGRYSVESIAVLDGPGLPEPESTAIYDLDELLDKEADRDILFPWPPLEAE